jgi:hypothetical protein
MPLLPSLIQVPGRPRADRALRDLHHIPVIRPVPGRLWARAAEAFPPAARDYPRLFGNRLAAAFFAIR